MASTRIENVSITGIASAVPERKQTLEDVGATFGEKTARRILKATGVSERRSSAKLCSSDLCEAAAERLLAELGWERESIGALIFVSQTADYQLPATSCVLHGRLGLPKSCAALDINLGCSGYIYGLMVAGQMVNDGSMRRVLLLVGDTISRIVSPEDRATVPLFGDAGTATGLEFDGKAQPLTFVLGTDGTGYRNLIVPAGGARQPVGSKDLSMDGSEVFTFTLKEVPALLKETLATAAWKLEDVRQFIFHQANQMMLDYLVRKMEIDSARVPLSIAEYGNTSSASIPLTISDKLRDGGISRGDKLLLIGFGVGFSWASLAWHVAEPLVLPALVEVSDVAADSTGPEQATTA